MSWVAGTPLIADIGELRRYLGPEDFSNLQTGGYDLAELFLAASDEVRASIRGFDPANLANAADYKPAVAAHIHVLLLQRRFLRPADGLEVPANPFDWSKPRLLEVEPRLVTGTTPTRIGAGLPHVLNINSQNF